MSQRTLRATVASAALAASALLLGACATEVADAAELEWAPGPLDEYQARIFGFSHGESDEDIRARWDADIAHQENLIAACMAEQGFEYIPDVGATTLVTPTATIDWDSREFAERYGFGISTDWQAEFLEQATAPADRVDPNAEIVARMSDSERDAWRYALQGEPQFDDWDPARAGCFGQAMLATSTLAGSDHQFSALEREMLTHGDRVQADPRVVQMNEAWSSCLIDAGFTGFANPGEMSRTLWDEWDAMNVWGNADLQAALADWDWQANPDGPAEFQEMLQAGPADKSAFTEREIALAVASWECNAAVNRTAIEREVDLELQAQFVEQHGAELEAWAQHEEARRDR